MVLAGSSGWSTERSTTSTLHGGPGTPPAIKFLTDSKLVTGTIAAKDVTETKFADEAAKTLGAFTAP